METNELGFAGKSAARRFYSQRLGPNVAQAADEFHGPGLRCVFRAGWVGPFLGSLGRLRLRFSLRIFFFFRNSNKIS
jgi:hypothetical protein